MMAGEGSHSSRRSAQPADQVRQMDRGELVKVLRRVQCGFKMDFTDEFLATLSMDRLRHIVLAAILQARRVSGAKRRP